LKKILKYFYFFVYQKYFEFKFIKIFKEYNEIYIFDIDNTIADTWPSFLLGYSSLNERLSGLAIFYNMRNFILKLKKQNKKIIYLTARPYKTYNLTFSWLKSNGLIENKKDLILVSEPAEKVSLLKKLERENNIVHYYDDMSYNHENGEVKYYINEIDKIKKLKNIKYNSWQIIKYIILGEYNDTKNNKIKL